MHELSIVFQIIKTIDKVADEQNLDEIAAIVLEVGELSSVLPRYLEECFPAAIDKKPRYKNTELKIELIPGEAKCLQCGEKFNVIENKGFCPQCNSFEKDLIQGREFMIKEILVR